MNWMKKFLESEKKKIAHLSGKEKAAYIWEYYKLWIVGILSFVILVTYIGIRIHTTIADHWFYLGIVNTRVDVGTDSELWDGYTEYTGYDLSEKLVEFNDEIYFDYSENLGRGNDYYELFVAYIDSATLDAAIMETEDLELFGESGRLLDLSSETCSSIMEKYGDRLIYCQPYDTEYSTDPVPVGIDISDSIVQTKYGTYAGDCALGIGAYAQNIDAVEAFLDYIFTEE